MTRPALFRRILRFAAVAGLGLIAGCAAQLPPATTADALRGGTTLAALDRGRGLYMQHCSTCHALYRPETQPAAAWPKIVDEMATRSGLDAGMASDVVRYLTVLSGRETAVASAHAPPPLP